MRAARRDTRRPDRPDGRPGRHHALVKEPVYRLVIRIGLLLFALLGFRITVEGEENVPEHQGAVLASNHVSFFDFMFIGYMTRRRRRLVRFMAKQSVFDHPVAGPLMRAMHHIPVDRSAGASAYGAALRALRSGELVGVFPEATISRSFVPREMKSGAVRMALDAGVPLIPLVVWGGQRVWTANHKIVWRRGTSVTIRVGRPLEVPAGTSTVEATALLSATLTAMVDEVQRAYPDPATPGDDFWQPAHLGGSAPTPERAREIEEAAIARKREKRRRRAA
jgi:1-acyl-sn-glycerol-3-phosphate acyltransferase